MATRPVTVAFEGKDLISGVLNRISATTRKAANDILGFRRVAGTMYDDFIAGGRRASQSAQDLGRQVGAASDEIRGVGQERIGDIFDTARRGADHFRGSVSRADAEVRGMSDANIHLRARDEVSPALDGISAKIAAITATAGALVIGGGGVSDSLFSGVSEYTNEASRSAPYLSPANRQRALDAADQEYVKGRFSSRAEGAQQVANMAPLISDKSKIGDYVSSSAKMKFIMPDSGLEEINRSLSQSANVFKETPQQVTDSILYAYSKVGDRQQDLADTFWEYSGYFKKTGATSAQMSNFLVKSVQEGSFNFDKPADFMKETFGVKALDAGDMEKYFVSRGSSKDVAKKQADQFTSDINSNDAQRAKGALMALVGDLSSQKPDELKASLVQLGSATAEDNGDAILKTWKTPFEKAPNEINGTTDRLVKAQEDANPMLKLIQAQNQRDKLMQEIGGNIAAASLPALTEFNNLIVKNRDSIEGIGTSIASMTTKFTSFYKEHFTAINYIVAGLAGIFVAKKAFDLVKGGVNLAKGTAGAIGSTARKTKEVYVRGRDKVSRSFVGQGYRRSKEWAADTYVGRKTRRVGTWVSESRVGRGASKVRDFFSRRKEEPEPEQKRFKRPGTGADPFSSRSSLSSMTVQAGRVYVNGAVSGGGDRGIRERNPGNDRKRRGGRGYDREDIVPKRRTSKISRDKAQDLIRSQRPEPPPKKGLWSRVKDSGLLKGSKSLAKGAGIAGAVVGAGMGAYDLYQAAKKDGWRQSISTHGGATVGGIAGGALLGAAGGALLGPAGAMIGATAGNWLGTKAGEFFDSKGWTKSAVDSVVSLKDKVMGWWSGGEKETKKAGNDMKQMGVATQQQTGQTKQQLVTLGGQSGQTANQTKTSLGSIQSVTSRGGTWGTTMISGLISGISAQFPELRNAMAQIQSIMNISTPSTSVPSIASSGVGAYADHKNNGKPPANPLMGTGLYSSVPTLNANGNIINKPHWVGPNDIAGEAGMEAIIPLSSNKRSQGLYWIRKAAHHLGVSIVPERVNYYANGGVVDRPHLGVVGEAGPEAIIPLSTSRRSRAIQLWQQAGQHLGVPAHGWGGIFGRFLGGAKDGAKESFKTIGNYFTNRKKVSVDTRNAEDYLGYGATFLSGIKKAYKKVDKSMRRMHRTFSLHRNLTAASKMEQKIRSFAGFGKYAKWAGRLARPLAIASNIGEIFTERDRKSRNENIMKTAGGIAGGALSGAASGAAIGALVGAGVFSPVTATIGAAVGGLAGAIGGEEIGKWIYGRHGDRIDRGISWLGKQARSAYQFGRGFFGYRKYANGGHITSPHLGLVGEAGPEAIIPLSGGRRKRGLDIWQQTGRALGVRMFADGGFTHRASFHSNNVIPIARTLNQSSRPSGSVTIENINIDFGEMAKQVTNFAEFAKMMTSPEGRALLRKVFGEELYYALENGA